MNDQEKVHHIRNAILCIKYAFKTSDSGLLEAQLRRIEEAISSMATVADIIKAHEGFSPTLYRCTAGKLTIGYGYNIEDRGLPQDICEELLVRDITRCERFLRATYPWFLRLDDARQKALIDMTYQLGEAGISRFTKMLDALKDGNWELAYTAALDSKWARQTPLRAKAVALTLRTGDERCLNVTRK